MIYWPRWRRPTRTHLPWPAGFQPLDRICRDAVEAAGAQLNRYFTDETMLLRDTLQRLIVYSQPLHTSSSQPLWEAVIADALGRLRAPVPSSTRRYPRAVWRYRLVTGCWLAAIDQAVGRCRVELIDAAGQALPDWAPTDGPLSRHPVALAYRTQPLGDYVRWRSAPERLPGLVPLLAGLLLPAEGVERWRRSAAGPSDDERALAMPQASRDDSRQRRRTRRCWRRRSQLTFPARGIERPA